MALGAIEGRATFESGNVRLPIDGIQQLLRYRGVKLSGEKRVRVKFNPAQSGLVDEIKQKTAELINICYEISTLSGQTDQLECHRLISLAMTAYEEAAMWAVKAATVEKE